MNHSGATPSGHSPSFPRVVEVRELLYGGVLPSEVDGLERVQRGRRVHQQALAAGVLWGKKRTGREEGTVSGRGIRRDFNEIPREINLCVAACKLEQLLFFRD